MKLRHEFVTTVPEALEQGVIYVSIEYRVAIHSCCCGCGKKVVTPFSPNSWKLTFDGKTISLYPSIGNWNFECKSHYWITNNQVEWARKWTDREIVNSQRKNALAKTSDSKKNTEGIPRSFFKKKSDQDND